MSAAVSSIVTVDSLKKRFGAVQALDGVSFDIASGEIFGLVGPDGCGKTTTMRMLAAVMRPDEGRIVIEGIDVVADPEGVKQRISCMPQRFGLYEDLTVDENINFYADLFGVPEHIREARARRLLEASEMTNFRGFLAGQLSGGMKQKLGLTCALVHTPHILLLDEPTTGVDPVSRRDFWRILYDLREQGVTIVISTAYLDEAERCNRLALLHDGHLLYCDTPEALKQKMPGALVAISSSDGRAARAAIEKCSGVTHVLLVGDGVHAVVDDAELRIPQFRQMLSRAGVPTSQIAVVRPGIEDVFVALLEDRRANQ